ncbi:MAG: 16S rRNA (cytidine(1402)-2'-O)-methyltransferase [Armatimonadota bacterium]
MSTHSRAGGGTLYVVATPIGNLEDITERARRVLGEVELVIAEDTRRVRTLLSALGICVPTQSYHGDTHPNKHARIMARLVAGATMAYASDAGTPVLADPGAKLVAEAAAAGVRVVPVPGPSAITAALSACGYGADRFEFAGYAPRRAQERREWLRALVASPVTSVFFETPHRLRECLEDLRAVGGDGQPLVVCRELTKVHEQILRGTVGEAIAHFAAHEPRGEITLVLPPGAGAEQVPGPDDAAIRAAAARMLALGIGTKDATGLLCELTGRGRNEMYALVLALRGH